MMLRGVEELADVGKVTMAPNVYNSERSQGLSHQIAQDTCVWSLKENNSTPIMQSSYRGSCMLWFFGRYYAFISKQDKDASRLRDSPYGF
ncbi:hypothetical protein L6164_009907 [Bauhinia variegata]|uniref:Uncharacterized protein n=1 Tax=Bauhinia variegata TaxID=167791 RepID=A0ACB9PKM7_BAUVA|nr:hypothetical protein L6164_009907 [Bauhinia variegata]